ncbi:MAG: hemolysin III family protein [Microlunatus sp.]|nr:hemolysin III family protein [Microlunatus sp.]
MTSTVDQAVAAAARPAVAPRLRPYLRGWLHAAVTPPAGAAGIVMITRASTAAGRTGDVIFVAAAMLLFGTSALFHRYHWGPIGHGLLRRLDHSNIYLFIAASYTPYALCLLSGASRAWLLTLIWSAAVVGLLFRTVWLSAPRPLYTVMYVVMAGSAAGWLPEFLAGTGPGIFTLILGSGILYAVGAAVYAFKWPDPSPRWFGFHEVFHACTIAAFAVQCLAMSLVTH